MSMACIPKPQNTTHIIALKILLPRLYDVFMCVKPLFYISTLCEDNTLTCTRVILYAHLSESLTIFIILGSSTTWAHRTLHIPPIQKECVSKQ